jgi:hypothetical protein
MFAEGPIMAPSVRAQVRQRPERSGARLMLLEPGSQRRANIYASTAFFSASPNVKRVSLI